MRLGSTYASLHACVWVPDTDIVDEPSLKSVLLLSEDDTACASHSASAVWTHVKLIKCLLSGFFWLPDSNITAARTCVAHLAPSDGAIIDATRLIYALSKGCQPLTRVRNARRSTIKITKWQQEQARAANRFYCIPCGAAQCVWFVEFAASVCSSLSSLQPDRIGKHWRC